MEARWAVYFDVLGLKWDYELQGFSLGDGIYYLPDFWLPQVAMWAEVKADGFSEDELEKAWRLHAATQRPVLLLSGVPDFAVYKHTQYIHEPYYDCCETPPCPECKRSYVDCFVSMYHGYPSSEGRFYTNCGWADWSHPAPENMPDERWWRDEVAEAVYAARSARFEYGQSPDVAVKGE